MNNIATYDDVVSKALSDKNFKARLLENPKDVLKEFNLDIPFDLNITFIEERPNTLTLVLPTAPNEGELSVEELNDLDGGSYGLVCVVCN